MNNRDESHKCCIATTNIPERKAIKFSNNTEKYYDSSSKKEHMENALALGADERRGKLR